MKPIYLHNTLIGELVKPPSAQDPRIATALFDPRVLVACKDAENPNEMSEDEYQGLVLSIKQEGFNQAATVAMPAGALVTEDARGLHLSVAPEIADGAHRVSATILLGYSRIQCLWYTSTKPGEIRIIRIANNKWRGHLRLDIQQQQIMLALAEHAYRPEELLVTGLSPSEIEDLMLRSESNAPDNAGPELDLEPPKLPDKKPAPDSADILEIPVASVEDARTLKKMLRRYARAAGVTKGDTVLAAGLFQMKKLLDGEDTAD